MVRSQISWHFSGIFRVADFDECQIGNGGCNQTCTNSDGLFECSCSVGFIVAADSFGCDGMFGFCLNLVIIFCFADVDECLIMNGGCNQTCTNTYGSFQCSCGAGYSLSIDTLGCEGQYYNLDSYDLIANCDNTDVNECLSDNGGCNQTCTNNDGSYECSCNTGYLLSPDNLSCDGRD